MFLQIYSGNSGGGGELRPSRAFWTRPEPFRWPLTGGRSQAAEVSKYQVCVWVCATLTPQRGPAHLFLPLQPAVHHGVVGAEGGAGRLPLELPVVGPGPGVPGEAPVGVHAFTLRRPEKRVGTRPAAPPRTSHAPPLPNRNPPSEL